MDSLDNRICQACCVAPQTLDALARYGTRSEVREALDRLVGAGRLYATQCGEAMAWQGTALELARSSHGLLMAQVQAEGELSRQRWDALSKQVEAVRAVLETYAPEGE